MNSPGFVGDFILWKRGWNLQQTHIGSTRAKMAQPLELRKSFIGTSKKIASAFMSNTSPTFNSVSLSITKTYLGRIRQSLEAIDSSQIANLLNTLGMIRESGSSIFIAGNGGSGTTAEHIALDWMLGTGLSNPPLRVISLAQSTAAVTATGNDLSFENVFSRQLKSLAKRGDLLVVISASGNSPNLLQLVDDARELGVQVAAMTGFDGGRLAQMADLAVHVPTTFGDYGVAEDLHLMIGHIVKEALIAEENRGS